MTVAWGNKRRGTGGVPYKTSGADNVPGSRGVRREEDASLLFQGRGEDWQGDLLQGPQVHSFAMAEGQLPRGKLCVDAGWCSITHVGPVPEVLHYQHGSFLAEGHVALLAGSEPVGLRRVGRIGEEDQQDSSSKCGCSKGHHQDGVGQHVPKSERHEQLQLNLKKRVVITLEIHSRG
ncbi:Uncharacterized protein FKW44_000158 [Caligus rogercresseyi]|uniref:Uncharacterized protein n=1 Tax=Caligus rogercresseyi TaxID=217165 RepID=A0A7T8KH08_CALRO|nr:Uncharacterized protein FKW44_000158 [Caligus rogercresseyi]